MDVNPLALPIEIAARLTEFRAAMETARKFAAECSTKYILPEVLLKAD
jgi:hypothetical protein